MNDLLQNVIIALGALGGVGWIGTTALGALRARSQNKVDDANAESISVATLRATVSTLNDQIIAQGERHQREIKALRTEFEYKIESLRQKMDDRLKVVSEELVKERLRTDQLRKENTQLRRRIRALEELLKANSIDPDDIPPTPV